MQLVKKSLVIVMILFSLAMISALEVKSTEFVIKTEPYNNLSIVLTNPDTKEEVEIFEGRARKFGEFRFKYYGTISKVNMVISVINNETGEVIKSKDMGSYNLGSATTTIEFYVLEKETSEESQEEELIEGLNASKEIGEAGANKSKSLIQGLAIGENFEFSKTYYYVGAAVLGALILVLILKRRISTSLSKSPVEPHPSKVISSKNTKPSKVEVAVKNSTEKTSESSINETEKRISDLQKQLEQIRSEEKLLKLQKQLNQEKQSLKKMQEDLEDRPQVPQKDVQGFDNKEVKTF